MKLNFPYFRTMGNHSGLLRQTKESGENLVKIDLADDRDAFLAGNSINGQFLFPVSGYIVRYYF